MTEQSSDRKLNVFVNNSPIGTLKDIGNIWSFEYDESWVSNKQAFALCPDIPLKNGEQVDGSTTRPIQHFFDNLLPEENARKLLAKDLKIKDETDTFLLLQKSGKESAGALTLLPEGVEIPDRKVENLTDEQISERIANLPKSPLNNKEHKRMSLAGAQHKMLVIVQNGQFYEPNTAMPSTHILKPDHSDPDDYWQTTMNEWFIMTLAHKVGLNVPNVQIKYTPTPVYVIERFDRLGKYPDHLRLHIIDACQLLGLSKNSKYSSSNIEIYNKFIKKVKPRATVITKIYQWVLFNLLIGNGDAHLKNVSFHQTANGAQLAPFYDMLSTIIYEKRHSNILVEPLSIPIGTKTTFEDVTFDDLSLFSNGIGLPDKIMKKITLDMCKKIQVEFDALYLEVSKQPSRKELPGELRMLREINYRVLKPMLSKITVQ